MSVQPDTIDSLIQRGIPTVFYITGGGTRAISLLLEHGGASSFFLEAQVPYDNQCVVELLGGHKPDQYCNAATARMLATCAYRRAVKLVGNEQVIGVGVTAKLRKAGDERAGRKHAAYVAIHGKNKTRVSYLPLNDTCRKRPDEEEVLSRYIVKEYCNYLDVPCFPPSLYNNEMPEVEEMVSTWSLSNHYPAHVQPLRMGEAFDDPLQVRHPTIFSGSFNPVHEGHIKVARRAYEITHKPVWFEISLTNCEKPPVDWVSVMHRVRSFERFRSEPAIAGFIFTNAPKFVEKARFFRDPTFVIGRDTLLRMDNPAYYSSQTEYHDAINELIHRQTQFLVFDRKGAMTVPYRHLGLEKICTVVDDYQDAGETSTDVRQDKCKDEDS